MYVVSYCHQLLQSTKGSLHLLSHPYLIALVYWVLEFKIIKLYILSPPNFCDSCILLNGDIWKLSSQSG